MTEQKIKYFDLLQAREAYREGRNVTELLRQQKHLSHNTSEIIEAAYDLQAGTYIEYVEKNPGAALLYASELAEILCKHLDHGDSLLDVGSGEMTTLSLLASKLPWMPKRIYAFDISWSRLYKGLPFASRKLGPDLKRLVPFVADIAEIPLPDRSVDITTSSHALEPNGANLSAMLAELFRVTSRKLVLFEPCYEINSEEGRKRMDRLGYIKDVEGTVKRLGGQLLDRIAIRNSGNPLNPTACFVIAPPPAAMRRPVDGDSETFSVPGTSQPLARVEDFYFSQKTGLCFPVLKSIPILKSNAAILASALMD